jgi:hypothetical protein
MRVRNEHDREIGVVAEWLTLYRNLATQICWTSTNYYLGEGADALGRSNDVNSSRSTSETGMTTTSSFRSTPPTRFRVLDFRLAAHLGDGHVQLLEGGGRAPRRPRFPSHFAQTQKDGPLRAIKARCCEQFANSSPRGNCPRTAHLHHRQLIWCRRLP